jgi:hypothetical protein
VAIVFRTTDIGREIYLRFSPAPTGKSALLYDTSTSKLMDLSHYNCSHGCTVKFDLQGYCNKVACINSISIRLSARVTDPSGAHVYSNTKMPYMPLYWNYWSPVLTIEKGRYVYFEYTTDAAGDYISRKSASLGSSVLLISGLNKIGEPKLDDNEWVQLDDEAFNAFVKGSNNMALYGSSKMSVLSTTGSVCIGDVCDNSASSLFPLLAFISLFLTCFFF